MNKRVNFQTGVCGLFHELAGAVHIAQSADWVRSTPRNDVRCLAVVGQPGCDGLHLGIHIGTSRAFGYAGPMQPIQQNVAVENVIWIVRTSAIFEQDMAPQIQFGRRRCGLTGVI